MQSAVPVAFVSSHAALGGSERMLELLLGALEPAWIADVVVLGEGPAVERLGRAAGVAPQVVPAGRRAGLVTGAWRLRRALARSPAAVVHASGVKAALVAVLGLAGTGTPVLWVKHDFSWDGLLGALVASRCAEVVGVSEAVLTALRAGRPRLRTPPLHVVANGIPEPGVDPAAARTALERELGLPAGTPLVVLVGRLHPAKGQREIVEAAPALLRRCPAARIVLAGATDPSAAHYAAALRARIAELGLSEAVVLLGHRDDAAALTAAADVAVVPSVPDERGMGREGFGLAGVEALAAGTAVAGYADGALPEVLGDAARLVAPGDRAALAGAIADLLGDPGERHRLAALGRERFATRFGVEGMADGLRRRYAAVAGRGG